MMNTTSTSTANSGKTVCPICGGVGFLRRDLPVDHPDFGRAIPCECKLRETQQAGIEWTRRATGLDHLAKMTFDTFRLEGLGLASAQSKNLRDAFEAAWAFATRAKGWLLLKGGVGCGKTHLAAAIANDRLTRGESVLFVAVPDLLDYLRATFAPSSDVTYDDRFESVRTTPFLILDDLGSQNATPWAQEKLFQILNHRYNAELPTVITTNSELEEIDLRIRSRLSDPTLCQIVTILVPDFRQSGVASNKPNLSNLALYDEMTFETFNLREGSLNINERKNLREVLNEARSWADSPFGFILFTGDYGCGKTHLAAAIANRIAKFGQNVVFVTVPDLLDHLRATFAPDSNVTYDRRFEEARRAAFLVLDDLGTENATPWAREKLFQIIDYRYVAHLPTIITIHRKAAIDQRIQARIFDTSRNSVNEILAPSYRQTHPRAQMKPESGYRKSRAANQS